MTPLMKQYLEIKAETGADSLLAYRMGDFYEFFFKDAETTAQVLGLVLTSSGKHEGKPLPMAGFPVHSAERYIEHLVSAGHSVAICEVVESRADAFKRGQSTPQRREVLRVVHPPREIGDFIDPANLPRLSDYVGV